MNYKEELQRAIQLTQQGQYEQAEKLYLELVKEFPEEPILYSSFGLYYVYLKNYDKAIYYLKHAQELKETPGTVSAYGFALYEKMDFHAAAIVLEHALSFGDNIDVYNKLISSLFEIRDYQKAIEYTEKMNELFPDNPKSIANKVKAYIHTGKLLEAEDICLEFLKEHQDNALFWQQLGFLKELIYSDEESAIECYKASGEFGNLNADYNIAVAYQKLCNFEKAEEYYNKFLKNFPYSADGKASLGMCLLTQKKFDEGYKLYYERDNNISDKYVKNLYKPGTKLADELTVVCDQGFGDHVQYIRYLPFLNDRKIKVAAPKSLTELFKANYPDTEFIDYADINEDIQTVRITDLPYVLGMNYDNIPFSEGYLNIEPADIKNDKLRVGLCWEAGAAGIRGMIKRTINIRCFEPILNMDNIQVYSFQYTDTLKGNEKYPQMINLAKDFKNFTDTAKALKAMDIVITVDTVIAHLAGALGVKTNLLLPYAADWRWFRVGDYKEKTTLWYKSITVLQQDDHISWENPLQEIIKILSAK